MEGIVPFASNFEYKEIVLPFILSLHPYPSWVLTPENIQMLNSTPSLGEDFY